MIDRLQRRMPGYWKFDIALEEYKYIVGYSKDDEVFYYISVPEREFTTLEDDLLEEKIIKDINGEIKKDPKFVMRRLKGQV